MENISNITTQNELVAAIKANDARVLEKLYQENYPKIAGHIVKNSGSMPQAKDTYQEAFIACYQNIKEDKFVPNSETALQGYLFTIAKNKWTDYLRSAHFKKVKGMNEVTSAGLSAPDTATIESTEETSKMDIAMEAFSQLGDECRDLLKQFYFDKKSMEEISIHINITEASARNKKYRCMQKLKAIVANFNA
jgi:RNA polymerase sigma factor (sigma-70 family)